MSFSDLPLDLVERAILAELVEAIRQPTYRPGLGMSSAPDQAFENLDLDPQIPDEPIDGRPASRREFIEVLESGEGGSPSERLSRGQTFCWAHVQEGSREDEATVMGHVHDLTQLAAWLHDASSGLSRAETRTWLRDLVRLPADETTLLAEQRAVISNETLAPYQMWSFHEGGGREPFSALAPHRSGIVNRLGLGHLDDPSVELVYWTHTLPPEVKPCRPTAWDAGLTYPWWRPTGRTEPLDGSGSHFGFPEVVHNPVGVRSSRTPIKEVDPDA